MGKLTTKGIEAELRRPRDKSQKLFDGGGLYLEVTKKGKGHWRHKFRVKGKERRLSLGAYPEVTLRMARDKHYEMRRQLAEGIDPSDARKRDREHAEATFENIAREWFEKKSVEWEDKTKQMVKSRLEQKAFPGIGRMHVDEIRAKDLLDMLRKIEAEGKYHTAHRVLSICGRVFRYAVITGRTDNDPTSALKGALVKEKREHRAGITEPKEFGALLRAIDSYSGEPSTRLALQLLPLVFARPGEVRHAEWSEVDVEKAVWTIPAEKMKMRRDHMVPLSTQALAILHEAQRMQRTSRYVFPSVRSVDRAMSDNTLNAALRRLGYTKEEMTSHGFRASARTMLDEQLRKRPDLIEHQLAHAVKGPLGRAYNRAEFLDERREMMQDWADWLDELKATK